MNLRRGFLVLAASAWLVAGVRPFLFHVQALGVLLRLATPADAHSENTPRDSWGSRLRDFDTYPLVESVFTFETQRGTARGRLYEPSWAAGRGRTEVLPGLVMVHGIHHLGMDEPRLVRFARSIASTGLVVLTPDVRELADYAVTEASLDTIGSATVALRHRLARTPRVGVMGMSFAGGLALLVAADRRFAPNVRFVVSVGAHDDLERISRFFATGRIEGPDGVVLDMKPHEYGPLVLVYTHAEDFFPDADVAVAKDALRLWLWEEKDKARARAADLSGPSKRTLDLLFEGKLDTVAPMLLKDLEAHRADMKSVSPHEHLGDVRVPVFLLHGASDNVIPASETLWLAKDLAPETDKTVLVSKLIGHVEVEGTPTWQERWAAVHFLGEVLREAHAP